MTEIWFCCTVKGSAFVGMFRRSVLAGYNSVSLKKEISDKTRYTAWCKTQKTTPVVVVIVVVVVVEIVVVT